MKLFVGLDVSSEKLDCCFLSDDDQLSILFEASLANDINGATEIKEKILELNQEWDFSQIIIGMGSSAPGYHRVNYL